MTVENETAGSAERCLLLYANPFIASVATLRELGLRARECGATVDALDVMRFLDAPTQNLGWRDHLYERVGAKYRRFILPAINGIDITPQMSPVDEDPPALPEDIETLRTFRVRGAKIGLAALSSAATLTQLAERESTATYGSTLADTWVTAHRAALLADQLRGRYDTVFVFNGRTASTRPFCDILGDEGTVVRYEIGAVPNSYVASPGPLHDSELIRRRVLAQPLDTEAGIGFFEDRRARRPGTDAHRFTGRQTVGLLPDAVSADRPVSMFTSSEDEFFAIRDSASFGDFASQFDVALALSEICREAGKSFALRLHPHLALKKNRSWMANWPLERLRERSAHIIEPSEPIDSYALVDASEAVVTCGSTISMEAAYFGKPSLVVGDNYATAMGICSQALDRTAIERFVRSPQPLPDARDNAIRFASYEATKGTPVRGLRDGTDPARARLDGRLIDPARHTVERMKRMVGRLRPSPG